jgi:hypothetical protein
MPRISRSASFDNTLVQVSARDGLSRLIQPGYPACLQSIEARNERRMRSRIVRRLRMGGA